MCAFQVADGHRRWCTSAGRSSGIREWPFRLHHRRQLGRSGRCTNRRAQMDLSFPHRSERYAAGCPHIRLGVRRHVRRDELCSHRSGTRTVCHRGPSRADALGGSRSRRRPWSARAHEPRKRSHSAARIGSNPWSMPWRLLRLEPKPGFGATFSSATAFLGRRAGLVFADANSFASVDERLSSFRVRVDDENGRTLQDRRYRPRDPTPPGLVCATTCEGAAVAIDRSFVYGRLHDVLYRFPWTASEMDSSTSLGEATSFIGRTSGGALIVTRRVGTWLVNSSANTIRSRQLSKDNVVVFHRTLGEFDVLGFGGGDVVIMDARHHVVSERTKCTLVDAVRADTLVVLACGGSDGRVEALATQR